MKLINDFLTQSHFVKNAEKLTQAWAEAFNFTPEIIYDVGANAGLYSIAFSQLFPDVKIYAFEPIFDTFEKLNQNIKLNDLDIKTFNIALWNIKTKIPLSIPKKREENKGLYSAFITSNHTTTTVEADTIDNLNLPIPNVVKLDAEGAEENIILGGEKTFATTKCFIIENDDKRHPNFPPYENLEKLLIDKGYNKVYKSSDEVWLNNNL